MFNRFRIPVFAAVALMTAAWASVASAADVVIMFESNVKFVRADRDSLAANADLDRATRFRMVRLQGNRVAFVAPNGRYVRAGVGQNSQLSAVSREIGGWETFEIVRNGRYSGLRSVQSGRYVTASGRGGTLFASARRLEGGAILQVLDAPRGQGTGNPPPRQPRVEWTGRWSQMWLASPNGNLHRPPEGFRSRFTISQNRDVEMTAGCNTVQARLVIDGTRARFESVTSTRIRCSNHPQGYERGMAQAFENVRSYEYREGQVAFLDARGRTIVQIGR